MYFLARGAGLGAGMPHLNEKEFQVLLDMTLYGERKFNLAVRLNSVQGLEGGGKVEAQGCVRQDWAVGVIPLLLMG